MGLLKIGTNLLAIGGSLLQEAGAGPPAPTPTIPDMIDEMQGRDLTEGEITAAMRMIFEEVVRDWDEGALPIPGVDGEWFEMRFSRLRARRIDSAWDDEQSEIDMLSKGSTGASSRWGILRGGTTMRLVRQTDFNDEGTYSFPTNRQSFARRPDPAIPSRWIHPDGSAFKWVDIDGGSPSTGTYSDFATASFPSFEIGDGEAGYYACLKRDGNDCTYVNIAGQNRLVYAISSNSNTTGIFVGDILSGDVLVNQVAGVAPNMTMEIVAIDADTRTPWNYPNTYDYGGAALTGDHLFFLDETLGGTRITEFDGTYIGEVLGTTPHTDTCWYTDASGNTYPALISKGTPGEPGTGQGDGFLQAYEIVTDGNTGARSVVLGDQIQLVDILASFSQGGPAQISAIPGNPDWVIISMKPFDYTPGDDYFGEDSIFLCCTNQQRINAHHPVGELHAGATNKLFLNLGPHGVNTESFGRQIEHYIGTELPVDDPDKPGYMNIVFRSENIGANTNNYMCGIEIPPIPTWERLLPYLSRLTFSVSSAAIGAGGSSTLSVTAYESDVADPVTDVKFYVNGALVNTDASAPYSYVHTFAIAGTYQVQAKLTDNNSRVWPSQILTVVVT